MSPVLFSPRRLHTGTLAKLDLFPSPCTTALPCPIQLCAHERCFCLDVALSNPAQHRTSGKPLESASDASDGFLSRSQGAFRHWSAGLLTLWPLRVAIFGFLVNSLLHTTMGSATTARTATTTRRKADLVSRASDLALEIPASHPTL